MTRASSDEKVRAQMTVIDEMSEHNIRSVPEEREAVVLRGRVVHMVQQRARAERTHKRIALAKARCQVEQECDRKAEKEQVCPTPRVRQDLVHQHIRRQVARHLGHAQHDEDHAW